jgi:hypothetical protein
MKKIIETLKNENFITNSYNYNNSPIYFNIIKDFYLKIANKSLYF